MRHLTGGPRDASVPVTATRDKGTRGKQAYSLVPKDTFDMSVFARDCKNLVLFGYAALVIGMAGVLIFLITGQQGA